MKYLEVRPITERVTKWNSKTETGHHEDLEGQAVRRWPIDDRESLKSAKFQVQHTFIHFALTNIFE